MKKEEVTDEEIRAFRLVAFFLVAMGILAFVLFMTFQYPFVSLTITGVGVLLLFLVKKIEKKQKKLQSGQS
ncbi:MAG: hypothetical protein N3E47_05040 [Candidatus Bathyarchaeota archaeon]|nr:hypothetical protein [Candidatus Bathyarchaeota archaeon]